MIGSSPGTIGIGPQRLIVNWIDPDSFQQLGGADTVVEAVLIDPSGTESVLVADWVWAIENVRGFYVVNPLLETPGTYRIGLRPAGGPVTAMTPFDATDRVIVPEIGQSAPRSETKTLSSHALEQLTTDPDPDPTFYRYTVAEAVTSGRISVLVFATPAFCVTAACGPTLDLIQGIAPEFPGVVFVHIEVYDNLDSAGQGELVAVPAVREWGLPSEPWVFVVDRSGTVVARFEGTVGREELVAVIEAAGT